MKIKVDNIEIMEISQEEIKCLKNDLVSPKNWFIKALSGKINQCKKRLFNEWIPKLRARDLTIPADDTELINLITGQADYKDRSKRDALE